MQIILYPTGGLANRMRAIDSAMNLANSKHKLSVWWTRDVGLNADFNRVFKTVPFVKDKELPKYVLKFLKNYDKRNKKLLTLLRLLEWFHIFLFLDEHTCLDKKKNNNTHQYLFCFIRTWEAFYPKENFHSELFELKNKTILEKELSKINDNTIGVHIRRTDNVWAIENSPLELFEQKMREELVRNKNVNFYLCSDDEKIKRFFQKEFWINKVKMPEGAIYRNSEEGIIQAVCEMFALSKTQKIIGSYWSSFGEIAARIGNIEIEICTTTQS